MILLKNGTYIDWKNLRFKNTDIYAEPGSSGIIYFKRPDGLKPGSEYSIDCSGKFITRSFACGHHHVYSALARGLPPPAKSPANFHEKLKYVWWILDQCLDRDMIYASALATAIQCAKHGCTFVIDHQASPNFLKGSLEVIKKAFDEVGIGHLLCYEITDRYGVAKAEEALYETEQYLRNNQGLVGLHAGFTVGEDTLKKSVALAVKYHTGIHIHVAEDPIDQQYSLDRYGKRVIHRFQDTGVFELEKNLLAHCLHLDAEERNMVRNSGSWIAVNTESNLNNRVGLFDASGLGDNIMLGTDGMHSDMMQSARSAYFSGQLIDKPSPIDIYQRLRNVHRYLDAGQFKGDGENSLVVLDYDSPTEVTAENFPGHFFYGMESRHIQHVIANGRLIVKDRELVEVDEQSILKETRKQASILWKKFTQFQVQ